LNIHSKSSLKLKITKDNNLTRRDFKNFVSILVLWARKALALIFFILLQTRPPAPLTHKITFYFQASHFFIPDRDKSSHPY